MNKNYIAPQFDIVSSLSAYCLEISVSNPENEEGYTKVEADDIFGLE